MLFSGTLVSGLSGTMNVGTMSLLTTCLAVLVTCGGCCIGSSTVFSFAARKAQRFDLKLVSIQFVIVNASAKSM